jgi:ERF superfamily
MTDKPTSIYKKLSAARLAMHALNIKKSGWNNFSQYSYLKLADFLPSAQKCFSDVGLCGVVSFAETIATLKIVDVDTGDSVDITSPMSKAALKGCHDVQNLGAVQTYIRRYLWVAALEIVEDDGLDGTKPVALKKDTISSTDGAIVSASQMATVQNVVHNMRTAFERGDVVAAYEEQAGLTDSEELMYMQHLLKPDSKLRSAMRNHAKTLGE